MRVHFGNPCRVLKAEGGGGVGGGGGGGSGGGVNEAVESVA